MAITDDIRKAVTDPTPLYFLAGAGDLALQEAKKVPGLVEQLRAEAPARIEAVRGTDPKAVQEKAQARAKEAGAKVKETQETLQTKVGEFITNLDGDIKKIGTTLDADLKKLGESAQDFALRGVGVAAEYAVKARETYEKVAEHGEQAVKTWRGEAAEEIEELAIAVEPNAEPGEVKQPATATPAAKPTPATATAAVPAPAKEDDPHRQEGHAAQDHHGEEGPARQVRHHGTLLDSGPGTYRVPGPFCG
ncbi:heparin binding hemagglutinin HbhA [Streptomyces sp. SAI-144]|nr:heparin binding hemagglutinin HbhA [Streptomyces sp. SAI-144]